jgi:hypothetical protein
MGAMGAIGKTDGRFGPVREREKFSKCLISCGERKGGGGLDGRMILPHLRKTDQTRGPQLGVQSQVFMRYVIESREGLRTQKGYFGTSF